MNQKLPSQDLIITRTFNAPIAEVWRAFSEEAYVKKWWGPVGFTCPVAKMDFREGGTSLVCMSNPEYGEIYRNWNYKKIIPMERIEYIRKVADQFGNEIDPAITGMPMDFPETQKHIVTLKPLAGNKTEMTFRECDWIPGQTMEISRVGLEQCLDKMESIWK